MLHNFNVGFFFSFLSRFLQKIQEESNSGFFSILVAAIPDGRKGNKN